MQTSDFLIVGIGASAGGIQAVKRFFEQVPAGSGIAYVVVLHLSPDHDSRLAEVLQGSAAIPVTQVRERVRVEPNHVYVIPPDKSLAMQDGDLVLSEIKRIEERRAPVDIFFRTLAQSRGHHAVCVILSGTGANGSMGIKRVKEMGGICLAQDPDEAEYSDMPRNSIATALVDSVLPVAQLPARIMAYKASLDNVQLPEEPAAHSPISDEQALRDLFAQLRLHTGHDFSNYKRATVLRRVARRMSLHEIGDLQTYAAFVREHTNESQALLKDLLISVTNFFRDKEAFDHLERLVIPKLFANKGEEDQVRVWVAGCATGEEVYSICMLLAEHASGVPGAPSIQVFATDIDEAAIAVAREGIYSLNDAADVPPERLRRFFTKEGNRFRVRKELREMVLFAHHNVVKDPPFSHLDLVSCRNLLIYLNRAAQHRVMSVLHFALNTGGYLFLGSSESTEGASDLFVPVEKDAFLFQSRPVTARLAVPVPELTVPAKGEHIGAQDQNGESRVRERLSTADLHQRLLEQYAPPSVVVNEEHDIVHLSERAGRYLQYAGGEPSHNLLKAIRPELRIEVRTALYQAAQQRTNVEARGLKVRIDDRTETVDVIVRPVIREADPARGFFLVLFQESSPDAAARPAEPEASPLMSGDTVRRLEEELVRVKAQLRVTIERHETQAEELKASNEELQAMNEELRSSAEELETSKEELQSLNEELRTVNQELKIKVEEQAQANDDIQNLINSTEIGTIFVDRGSRIKLFTPRARDIFTLIPADRGRPLSDISSSLVDVDLHADIEHVLDRLERVERVVRTRDDRWQLVRMLPYRTADDRIDGVVLTFLDITARTHAEEERRRSENRLRLIIESVAEYAIFTMDTTGRIDSWNAGAARMFGYDEREAIGQSAAMLFTEEHRNRDAPASELLRASNEGRASDERWHLRKDGSQFYASGVVAPLKGTNGETIGFVKVARDLTDRKRWEDALEDARAALESRVDQRTAELAAANDALDAKLRERRQAEDQIRGLIRRLLTVQEDERRRVSRDLHDHLGQQVAGLGLKIEGLHGISQGNPALRAAIEDVRQTLVRLDRDLDFFTWELRPAALDDLGLVVTLGNFIVEWSKEFGIQADFQNRGMDGLRLSYEIETSLYRITQEALNNIYKHARASRVGVILELRNGQAVLVIEDNGVGFDRSSKMSGPERGIGLLGMRERAALIGGTMEIETAPGRGTTVFVRAPAVVEPAAADGQAS
jgi:two-component system CheB/CheR fusion protein